MPSARTIAIVPVKSLASAKSRLAMELAPPDRISLMAQMVQSVLEQIAQVPAISTWAVVSDDEGMLRLAREKGGQAVLERGQGLNAALAQGREWAVAAGAEAILVLPGDVPLMRAADIEELLELAEDGPSVVIAPSLDRGTNALFVRPPDAIEFHFGPDSSELHAREARDRGVPFRLLQCERIAFDVDEPEDLYRYLEIDVGLATLGRPSSYPMPRPGQRPRRWR